MPNTQVSSQTQKIIVNPATYSVSVINAGPMGPAGPVSTVPGPEGPQGDQGIQGIQGETGPSEAASVLTVNGQILTRAGGILAPITRANLAADSAFSSLYQPLDSDLTAVAALATTPYGRALLALADHPDRELLDNGSFNICQRPLSQTAINSVSGVRVSDRWYMQLSGGPIWTISNEADAPAGSGLSRSQKWLCTTASASPAAGEFVIHQQAIEGQNLQRLLYGTASAKSVTLSFWVKSNKIGRYIAELNDAVFYGIGYDILVANTWEYKTVTFPGDTVNALINDSGGRLIVMFWLVAGSTWTGGSLPLNAWASTANKRAIGQVNVAAAINNYWQITGVQLEVGSVATPFQFHSYGDELIKCQRYFYESAKGTYAMIPSAGVVQTATVGSVNVFLPVRMRAIPTISYVGNLRLIDQAGASGFAVTSITDPGSGQWTTDVLYLNVNCSGGGMTVARVVFLQGNNDVTAAFRASAEI